MLKKPVFGFEGYNPKAKVKDLLPVHSHTKANAKRNTFCDDAIKMKDKVPSSDRYHSMLEWTKNPTSRNYRFGKDGRNMIAEEIIHKSKNPAKTSPGPAGYDHYDNWKSQLASPHGTSKFKESRITFCQEQEWHGEQSPPSKYPSIDPVSTLLYHLFLDGCSTIDFL